MQCPCGDETRYFEHEVKTLERAQSWVESIDHVPVIICRDVCPGCGRQEMRNYKYPLDVGEESE